MSHSASNRQPLSRIEQELADRSTSVLTRTTQQALHDVAAVPNRSALPSSSGRRATTLSEYYHLAQSYYSALGVSAQLAPAAAPNPLIANQATTTQIPCVPQQPHSGMSYPESKDADNALSGLNPPAPLPLQAVRASAVPRRTSATPLPPGPDARAVVAHQPCYSMGSVSPTSNPLLSRIGPAPALNSSSRSIQLSRASCAHGAASTSSPSVVPAAGLSSMPTQEPSVAPASLTRSPLAGDMTPASKLDTSSAPSLSRPNTDLASDAKRGSESAVEVAASASALQTRPVPPPPLKIMEPMCDVDHGRAAQISVSESNRRHSLGALSTSMPPTADGVSAKNQGAIAACSDARHDLSPKVPRHTYVRRPPAAPRRYSSASKQSGLWTNSSSRHAPKRFQPGKNRYQSPPSLPHPTKPEDRCRIMTSRTGTGGSHRHYPSSTSATEPSTISDNDSDMVTATNDAGSCALSPTRTMSCADDESRTLVSQPHSSSPVILPQPLQTPVTQGTACSTASNQRAQHSPLAQPEETTFAPSSSAEAKCSGLPTGMNPRRPPTAQHLQVPYASPSPIALSSTPNSHRAVKAETRPHLKILDDSDSELSDLSDLEEELGLRPHSKALTSAPTPHHGPTSTAEPENEADNDAINPPVDNKGSAKPKRTIKVKPLAPPPDSHSWIDKSTKTVLPCKKPVSFQYTRVSQAKRKSTLGPTKKSAAQTRVTRQLDATAWSRVLRRRTNRFELVPPDVEDALAWETSAAPNYSQPVSSLAASFPPASKDASIQDEGKQARHRLAADKSPVPHPRANALQQAPSSDQTRRPSDGEDSDSTPLAQLFKDTPSGGLVLAKKRPRMVRTRRRAAASKKQASKADTDTAAEKDMDAYEKAKAQLDFFAEMTTNGGAADDELRTELLEGLDTKNLGAPFFRALLDSDILLCVFLRWVQDLIPQPLDSASTKSASWSRHHFSQPKVAYAAPLYSLLQRLLEFLPRPDIGLTLNAKLVPYRFDEAFKLIDRRTTDPAWRASNFRVSNLFDIKVRAADQLVETCIGAFKPRKSNHETKAHDRQAPSQQAANQTEEAQLQIAPRPSGAWNYARNLAPRGTKSAITDATDKVPLFYSRGLEHQGRTSGRQGKKRVRSFSSDGESRKAQRVARSHLSSSGSVSSVASDNTAAEVLQRAPSVASDDSDAPLCICRSSATSSRPIAHTDEASTSAGPVDARSTSADATTDSISRSTRTEGQVHETPLPNAHDDTRPTWQAATSNALVSRPVFSSHDTSASPTATGDEQMTTPSKSSRDTRLSLAKGAPAKPPPKTESLSAHFGHARPRMHTLSSESVRPGSDPDIQSFEETSKLSRFQCKKEGKALKRPPAALPGGSVDAPVLTQSGKNSSKVSGSRPGQFCVDTDARLAKKGHTKSKSQGFVLDSVLQQVKQPIWSLDPVPAARKKVVAFAADEHLEQVVTIERREEVDWDPWWKSAEWGMDMTDASGPVTRDVSARERQMLLSKAETSSHAPPQDLHNPSEHRSTQLPVNVPVRSLPSETDTPQPSPPHHQGRSSERLNFNPSLGISGGAPQNTEGGEVAEAYSETSPFLLREWHIPPLISLPRTIAARVRKNTRSSVIRQSERRHPPPPIRWAERRQP